MYILLLISKDFWSLILCIIFILIWTKTKTFFYCFKFSNSKLVSTLLDLKRNNNTSSKRISLKYLYLLCKYLHSVYWYAKQNASFSSNICVCLKKILASIFVRHQEMLIKPLNPNYRFTLIFGVAIHYIIIQISWYTYYYDFIWDTLK